MSLPSVAAPPPSLTDGRQSGERQRASATTGATSSFATVSNENVASGTWVPFVDQGISPFCQLTHAFKATASGNIFSSDTYRVIFDGSLYGADQAPG